MDSKAVQQLKARVNSKVKMRLANQVQHHLIPGHIKSSLDKADFSEKLQSDLFKEYPYGRDYPKPLLPPSILTRDIYEGIDPTMQLVKVKNKMASVIESNVAQYRRHLDKMKKLKSDDIKWEDQGEFFEAVVPDYLAKTAAIFESDPDPHFSGNYNWYYSGGTLSHVTIGKTDILIFPFRDELIAMPIELKENFAFSTNFQNAGKMPDCPGIYEIISSSANNFKRILCRQKNRCTLYKLIFVDNQKLNMMELHHENSEVPFISCDLDPLDNRRYCGVDVNRAILLRDTECSKPVTKGIAAMNKSNPPVDKWACLKYDLSDNNLLTFTDRQNYQKFDARLPIKNPVLKISLENYLEDCEHLSSYCQNALRPESYFYLGSTHTLSLCDVRMPGQSLVKKWTHQFKFSPIMTKSCVRGNREFLIIASRLTEEMSVVLNDWDLDDLPSSFCPFLPPNALETLTACQLQGECLDPLLRIRLSCDNVGCVPIYNHDSEDVYLFRQNSLNDMFYQNLMSDASENSLTLFKDWNRHIEKNVFGQTTIPLVYTDKCNAKRLFDCLTDKKLRMTVPEDEELDYVPSWQRSVTELNQYVDLLGPELLQHWQMPEESVCQPSTAPVDKVMYWLDSQPLSQITPDSQEAPKVEAEGDAESVIIESQSRTKKTKKATTAHVPGF